jgi:hypothetical protein
MIARLATDAEYARGMGARGLVWEWGLCTTCTVGDEGSETSVTAASELCDSIVLLFSCSDGGERECPTRALE